MKKLLYMTLIATTILTSCGGGFSADERAIIGASGDGIMPLWTVDNPEEEAFLRLKAEPLTASMVDEPEFQVLKERMLATVCDPTNEGVGIAAPQVGISRRLVAVQRFDKEGEPFEFYINPEIVARSEERELGSEGCLSVPEMSGDVWRSTAIRLRYHSESDFSVVEEDIEDFTAVIFQHELDHLDGVLYIDYLEE